VTIAHESLMSDEWVVPGVENNRPVWMALGGFKTNDNDGIGMYLFLGNDNKKVIARVRCWDEESVSGLGGERHGASTEEHIEVGSVL
jgi:hypothetical protein